MENVPTNRICNRSPDGRHNFAVTGQDCANGCGLNQAELSGGFKKPLGNMKTVGSAMQVIFHRKAPPKGIHSELHGLIDELRKEFGETATKGVGSFGFYLGKLKSLGTHFIYQTRSEIRQSNAREPKKLFWWKVGKALKERREAAKK